MSVTRVLLVRHAEHELGAGVLAGRQEGVALSERGKRQAQELVARLQHVQLAASWSSPLDRALQTAAPLSAARGLHVEVDADLVEVDFGAWTGKRIADLDRGDADWQLWNRARGTARAPGGETIAEVQRRFSMCLRRAQDRHAGRTLVWFTHADVIRAGVAQALGLDADLLLRFDIDLASVSVLESDGSSTRVRSLNCTGSYTAD